MRIIIVGAGLGGLTAALGLTKSGHEVIVLERRETLAPQGGGLNVRPGASRILRNWGLEPYLEAMATHTPSVLLRSVATGDIIVKHVPVEASEYPDWGTSRRELIDVFYREALAAGAQIRFGATIVDAGDDEAGNQAYIVLKDGTRMSADLVLAADGVRSRIRPLVLSDLDCQVDPEVSKNTLYGFEVPIAKLKELPGTSRLLDQVSINCWMGKGGFVVSRHSPKAGTVGFVFGIHAETDQKDLWDENGDIQFVRDFFKGCCIELATPLQLATSCDRWRITELPDLPRWTSKGGRVVLLGDSAHAMHPNAAQGYSQIVEDIGMLDALLSQAPKNTTVAQITKIWQDLRKPRVDRIKSYAKWNTMAFSGESNTLNQTTHSNATISLKNVPPNMNAGFYTSGFLKWVIDYDAVGVATEYLNKIPSKL